MGILQLHDTYKTETDTIIYIEENDITGDCPLMATQWLKRGNTIDIRTVVPLKKSTEEELERLYSKKNGTLTYLGNFEDFEEAMSHLV